ncbi:YraN family protein [Patescibacteria group bacterium]|nr:YraN family protein [Patescibacteria group bacterium]
MKRKNLGKRGEDIALDYLTGHSYRFVDRNFSCPIGEIDLVVKDTKTLVFVEVKTRWSKKYGTPESAVTPRKLRSITKTALWFKKNHPSLPDRLRIDVVAIDVDDEGALLRLRHIKNVTG